MIESYWYCFVLVQAFFSFIIFTISFLWNDIVISADECGLLCCYASVLHHETFQLSEFSSLHLLPSFSAPCKHFALDISDNLTHELTSPGYPHYTIKDTACFWTIQASPGYRIAAKVHDFSVSTGRIAIGDGLDPGNSSSVWLTRFHLSTVPDIINARGGAMWISMINLHFYPLYHGFRLSFFQYQNIGKIYSFISFLKCRGIFKQLGLFKSFIKA